MNKEEKERQKYVKQLRSSLKYFFVFIIITMAGFYYLGLSGHVSVEDENCYNEYGEKIDGLTCASLERDVYYNIWLSIIIIISIVFILYSGRLVYLIGLKDTILIK